jgi:hypothetical protein
MLDSLFLFIPSLDKSRDILNAISFLLSTIKTDIINMVLCRFYVDLIFVTYWLLIIYFFNVENVDF